MPVELVEPVAPVARPVPFSELAAGSIWVVALKRSGIWDLGFGDTPHPGWHYCLEGRGRAGSIRGSTVREGIAGLHVYSNCPTLHPQGTDGLALDVLLDASASLPGGMFLRDWTAARNGRSLYEYL